MLVVVSELPLFAHSATSASGDQDSSEDRSGGSAPSTSSARLSALTASTSASRSAPTTRAEMARSATKEVWGARPPDPGHPLSLLERPVRQLADEDEGCAIPAPRYRAPRRRGPAGFRTSRAERDRDRTSGDHPSTSAVTSTTSATAATRTLAACSVPLARATGTAATAPRHTSAPRQSLDACRSRVGGMSHLSTASSSSPPLQRPIPSRALEADRSTTRAGSRGGTPELDPFTPGSTSGTGSTSTTGRRTFAHGGPRALPRIVDRGVAEPTTRALGGGFAPGYGHVTHVYVGSTPVSSIVSISRYLCVTPIRAGASGGCPRS